MAQSIASCSGLTAHLLVADNRNDVIVAESADEFVKAIRKQATSLFDLVFPGIADFGH